MKKIKDSLLKIKENKVYNTTIQIIWIGICVFLFLKMVLNLGYVSESIYQTIKDYYFVISVSFFLLAVLMLQKVKPTNILLYIFIPIYGYIAYRWLKTNEMNWGEGLQNVYKMRWVCGGILGVSLLDMIRYKKIAPFKERNWFATIIYIVSALFAFFISKKGQYTPVLLMPFIPFYLIKFNSKDWSKWILSFTFGYYGAFVYTMIQSFCMVPYTGERYYGIYVNHGLFGIFIGGAFVCSLWWVLLTFQHKLNIWLKLCAIIAMLFTIVCIVMNGARVAELAIGLTAVAVFCLWGGKSEKKQVLYRTTVAILFLIICIVILVGGLSVLRKVDSENVELFVQNEIVREKLFYWIDRAETAFNEESKMGIIKGGSILNAIDRFSSARISYAIVYLRNLNWYGHEHYYLQIGDTPFTHPHNTFIYWLYGMGTLSGVLMIGWIIYYFVTSLYHVIKKREEFFFTFLWVVYYMVAGLNEDHLWVYMTGFILLIVQYPLFLKWEGQKPVEEKKEK